MDGTGFHQTDPFLTRASLVGRIRDQQNESAWTEFVSCYRKYLYNFVVRMGFHHHDADEIVQIVLLKVWDAMPAFEYHPEKGRFRAWLCTIAGNAARNFARDRSGGQQDFSLSGINWDNVLPEGISSSRFSIPPEVETMAEEEWQKYLPELALKRVEGHFSRRTIQAFSLFCKGLSVPEIADRLNLSPSSVYVYKQRVAE